jgi:transmembrane sensor
MTDELDWTLAAKYLAGELSPKDRADFDAWLSANPNRAAQMSSLDKAFGSSTMPAVDVEKAWSRLSERMNASPRVEGSRTAVPELSPRPRIMSFSRPKRRAVYWALPALAAAGLAAFLTPSIRSAISSHTISGPELTTIATATGERKSVVLAQGIDVILGPSTSLELDQEIAGNRVLRLNGEAYFTVAHNQHRRLYVRTASALIEDIGTVFDVRALPGAARTDVAVVEGVVSLRSAQGAVTSATVLNVSAGSTGTVEGTAPPKLAPGGRSDDALAWTRGQLAFRDAPLSAVALELNRWYGLHVSIADPSLAARTLSARFAGESAETVLNVIARTLGISYQLEGQRVTFRSQAK